MQAIQAAMTAAAGVLLGWFNNRLLYLAAARARRIDRADMRILITAAAYIARYALIIAVVLLIVRHGTLQSALLFLAGMVTFTLGAAIFGRAPAGGSAPDRRKAHDQGAPREAGEYDA